MGNLNKDFDDLMDEIDKIITHCEDYQKLKDQICEFVNNHRSKNMLFSEIDDSSYKFDQESLDCIKKLDEKKMVSELEKIANKFVTIGDINKIRDFEFTNMFMSCQKNNTEQHCSRNRLIIDKKTLHGLLEILKSDILNPVKEKWLFTPVMSDNVVDFYKFIKRPDETIVIESV